MVSPKRTSHDVLKSLQSILILFILTNVCHENSGWAVEKNTEERPNILFLFADDWGRHASVLAKIDGAGGINDVVQTPNFDKVASRGVIFRNAHVSAPRAHHVVAPYLQADIFGKRELVQYYEVLSMTVRSRVFRRFFESKATASATPIRSGVPVLRQIHHSQKMKALAKTAVG